MRFGNMDYSSYLCVMNVQSREVNGVVWNSRRMGEPYTIDNMVGRYTWQSQVNQLREDDLARQFYMSVDPVTPNQPITVEQVRQVYSELYAPQREVRVQTNEVGMEAINQAFQDYVSPEGTRFTPEAAERWASEIVAQERRDRLMQQLPHRSNVLSLEELEERFGGIQPIRVHHTIDKLPQGQSDVTNGVEAVQYMLDGEGTTTQGSNG